MRIPFLPDTRKLSINSPALKGAERIVQAANTDADPSTISMKELNAYGRLQEDEFAVSGGKNVTWFSVGNPHLQAVKDVVAWENKSPIEKSLVHAHNAILDSFERGLIALWPGGEPRIQYPY